MGVPLGLRRDCTIPAWSVAAEIAILSWHGWLREGHRQWNTNLPKQVYWQAIPSFRRRANRNILFPKRSTGEARLLMGRVPGSSFVGTKLAARNQTENH